MKVDKNEIEKDILSKLEFIEFLYKGFRYEWINKKVPDLALERILTICTDIFQTDRSEFLGKINHADRAWKIRRLAFYSGIYFFSNLDTQSLIDFTQYRGRMIYSSFSSTAITMKRDKKNGPIVNEFFKELWKACPNRIKRLSEVNLDMLDTGCVTDWSNTVSLTAYQISKMPLKELTWFFNNNKWYSMLCFNPNRELECKHISFTRTSDHLLFFALQSQGYRFTRLGDQREYKKYHPICDRCLHVNNCNAKKAFEFGGFGRKNFECFEDVPEDRLKTDIKLLLPLKQYQLQ